MRLGTHTRPAVALVTVLCVLAGASPRLHAQAIAMRLGIIQSDELAEETQSLTTKSGVAVTWVNYVGTMATPSRTRA